MSARVGELNRRTDKPSLGKNDTCPNRPRITTNVRPRDQRAVSGNHQMTSPPCSALTETLSHLTRSFTTRLESTCATMAEQQQPNLSRFLAVSPPMPSACFRSLRLAH